MLRNVDTTWTWETLCSTNFAPWLDAQIRLPRVSATVHLASDTVFAQPLQATKSWKLRRPSPVGKLHRISSWILSLDALSLMRWPKHVKTIRTPIHKYMSYIYIIRYEYNIYIYYIYITHYAPINPRDLTDLNWWISCYTLWSAGEWSRDRCSQNGTLNRSNAEALPGVLIIDLPANRKKTTRKWKKIGW